MPSVLFQLPTDLARLEGGAVDVDVQVARLEALNLIVSELRVGRDRPLVVAGLAQADDDRAVAVGHLGLVDMGHGGLHARHAQAAADGLVSGRGDHCAAVGGGCDRSQRSPYSIFNHTAIF